MARWEDIAERNWGARREATYDVPGALAATRQRVLDAIARNAFDNLRAHSNYCRATLWAIDTHLHVGGRDALRGASALAGGIAETGETCGAVVGSLMAVGYALGTDDFTDLEADKVVREAGKRFVGRFRDLFGSTRCWEVEERIVGWRCDDPSRNDAWYAAGGGFACAAVCAAAARIAGGIILDAARSGGVTPPEGRG